MTKDFGLLIFRLGFGLTMLFAHGWGKLIHFPQVAERFPDVIGLGSQVSLALAVFAEVFCAAAVALGALTRWATVPLVITMAVAFFVVHGSDPWSQKELAFLYLVSFVTLFCTGAGSLSLDHKLGLDKRRR